MEDVRLKEGLKACMNCGVCTAVCPAAAFYNYDPRQMISIVQTRDDEAIEALLKSDTIWYCGECMSCRKNILDAYQSDIDKGAGRDSAYIYGPSLPRTYFFGIKLTL